MKDIGDLETNRQRGREKWRKKKSSGENGRERGGRSRSSSTMGEIEREPSHMREGENEGHVTEEYGLSSKSIEDEGREGEIGEARRGGAVGMTIELPVENDIDDNQEQGDEDVWMTPQGDLSPRTDTSLPHEESDDDAGRDESETHEMKAAQRSLFTDDTMSEDRSLVEVQSLRASVESIASGQPQQQQAFHQIPLLAGSTDSLAIAVNASLGSDKSVADLLHTLDTMKFDKGHTPPVSHENDSNNSRIQTSESTSTSESVQSKIPLLRPYTFRKQGFIEQKMKYVESSSGHVTGLTETICDNESEMVAGNDTEVPSPRTMTPVASPNKQKDSTLNDKNESHEQLDEEKSKLLQEKIDLGEKTIEKLQSELENEKEESTKRENELRKYHRISLARLKAESEKKLIEKQKEVDRLSATIKELEKSREAVKEAIKVAGDANESLTLNSRSVIEFKRDLEDQEVLLAGYQQENKSAMERIKELENKIKEKDEVFGEERKRTAEQMNVLHGRSDVTNAEQHAKLKRVLELEAERTLLVEEHETRVREMRIEIERLREGKKIAEQRAAGIDPAAYVEEDARIKELQKKINLVYEEMDTANTKSAEIIKDLEQKLQWYVSNQEVVGKQDDRIKEMEEENEQLSSELKTAKRDLAVGALRQIRTGRPLNAKEGDALKRRIKELEDEVLQHKETIKKQFPNSLSAMVLAAKPSVEENETIVELRKEIVGLQNALKSKDKNMEISLSSLRQEHDKLRIHYEGRLATTTLASKGGRVKDLEKQIEELRSFYGKKVKDLQRNLETQQKNIAMRQSSENDERERKREKLSMEKQLKEKESTIENLRKQIKNKRKEFESNLMYNETATISNLRSQLADAIVRAERVEAATAEHSHLKSGGVNESSLKGAMTNKVHDNEVEDLKRQLEAAEISRQTLQRAQTEAMERIVLVTLEHERKYSDLQQKYLQRIKDESQPQEKLLDRAQKAETDVIAYKRRIELLEQSLQSEESIIMQHQQLEVKLRSTESKYEEREKFWTLTMTKAKQFYDAQIEKCKERVDIILQEKTAEVSKFKTELENIMTIAMQLKKEKIESKT